MRLAIFLLIFCIFEYALTVDQTNFKTCDQSSFCRRCRKVKPDNPKFALVPGTLNIYSDSITADLIHKDNKHLFSLKLEALEQSNTFRLLVDEKTPLKPRYKVQDALKSAPKPGSIKVHEGDTEFTITSGPNKAVVTADPFRVDFYQNDILTVSVNAKGLMTFEHLRPKPQQPADGENAENPAANDVKEADEIDDPGAWEENFKSHHDSKPYGPEAIALDFSFPEAEVLFGIPEHADSFALKSTSGTDPYRLYNVDVFEYIIDSKMALYGSVPVIYGHGGGTIVPKKERIRRAATLMKNDPYTLVVCLNSAGKAEGTIYLDDEKSYNYRKGEYNYINMKFENNVLDVNFIGKPNFKTAAWIERVVIAGLGRIPKSATLIIDGASQELEILPHGEGVAVRKPGISVQQIYNIRLNF
ncbi:PREDICTED: neutral alpha-glucosidase AB-like [Rhagoletis zephyria]|uniref:neutral alpha-glucosidase AB-like n=1 Tax=Rhagoletis zephyria TaxID=28612 RepID=UPI0008114365|nr:PREDICTED: neutral alpha-glucosidase AB-like [Rhagoletis zephyria]